MKMDLVQTSRRSFMIKGSAAVAALAVLPNIISSAHASNGWEDEMSKMFGGTDATESGVTLTLPEIAENGNTVPFSVSVDSPMTADDHVKSVTIYSTGNPRPGIATFNFSPEMGVAEASSRMRLGKTQDVVAVAKMSNGDLHMAKTTVKVTIGGCGG
ncbi:MAG: thiosulfate oxidation carrier protein SoxY [Alphaproteobacteria bacterium]